jgi:hypothetical protein
MGAPRSLDIDLLRSFLLIAGGVSFTHTAERVGRTQDGVTLQNGSKPWSAIVYSSEGEDLACG